MKENKYTSPALEEIKIKVEDIMEESVLPGEGGIDDGDLWG